MLWNKQARRLRQCCMNTPAVSLRRQRATRGLDAALVMKFSYIIQCFSSHHLTTHGRGLALCTDWPRYTAEWKNTVKAAEMTLCFWSGFDFNCKWKSAVCRHVSTDRAEQVPQTLFRWRWLGRGVATHTEWATLGWGEFSSGKHAFMSCFAAQTSCTSIL